jgi:hypothetical protein
MNTEERIKQCLKATPKPPTPDSLLDKLRSDVSFGEVKAQRTALRRWFAPAGSSISPWRLAVAATIAIVVLLPLSYGVARVVKSFTLFEAKFEYPEDNTTYGVSTSVIGDTVHSAEDALDKQQEFYQLYRDGKAEEIEPGIWAATLSDGSRFGYGGNPEDLGLSDAERREVLKRQFDEINELRKAGEFEKTYMPENDFEIDGVKYRFFRARYVLSDGTVKTVGSSEPATEDQDNN